ncbi:multidrug export protein EmrA [Actinobacillus delphinicola]|nr:HlyD family efflux transporter periplasmic adaptor subunit [Actinobacillus delphinicola]MDG6897455.1 multidrug export protein EmrA [Actinobacillus delphinicola]
MIETTTTKKKARKKSMTIFGLVILLVVVLSFLYWLFFIRGSEETDDAYVHGNQVAISSQVAGSVMQINVQNTEYVHQGDVLVVLNPKDRELAFAHAKDELAQVVRKERNLMYSVKELEAAVVQKQIAVKQTKSDYMRQVNLAKTNSTSNIMLTHSKDAYDAAVASLKLTQNQLAANKALLLDTPLRQQPAVKIAITGVKDAWLNLKRTKVLSPVDGYVAKRNVQVGETIAAGTPLMAIVPANQMWVEANFKETQMKDMRIGQKARVTFDLYGDDVKFDGTVKGIEMGTGSAFSLLPAQNATGNWIKIVQRVPVRIALPADQIKKYPLRIGLSSLVRVDVSDTAGETLRAAQPIKAVYKTDVLTYNESELDNVIEQIIKANIGD